MFSLLVQKVSKPEVGSNEQKTELQKQWFSSIEDVVNSVVQLDTAALCQVTTAHAQVPASFTRGKLLEGFCLALNFIIAKN